MATRAGADRFVAIALGEPRDRGDEATTVGTPQTRAGAWWDGHQRLGRAVAVTAMAWTAAYLVWRVGWSWDGANPVTWALLLSAEVYGLWSLLSLSVFSWQRPPTVRPPATPGRRVDLYVCTYDEPLDVLRATLVGCRAVTYPHATWVLDDGRREEVRELAEQLGARYLTRPDNRHAKAGNVNHALGRTEGELVLVLDADHVPMPDAIDAVVGYFDDPQVALVQTPHDFYNQDSVQHYEVGRHEQTVFFEVICPGKDRHGAAFWCGSGALIRRDALLDVGGVATETTAEDFHTTIKLHRAGWSTRYHREVVVQGRAPHDLASYLLQRDRWARGNLAVFRTPESPWRARELTFRQRWSYFASLTAYAAGAARLATLVVLAATLWTSELPLRADLSVLALLWAPATLLSFAAAGVMCRGYMRTTESVHFELSTMEIYTRALRCAVVPGSAHFAVTPKEGVDLGGWAAIRQVRLVALFASVLTLGVALRSLGAVGVDPLPGLPGIATWVVPLLAVAELRRLLRTLHLVGRRRQRRLEHRFPEAIPATFTTDDGHVEAIVIDASPTGAAIVLRDRVPIDTTFRLEARFAQADGRLVPFAAGFEVRSCRRDGDLWRIGARIVDVGPEDLHHLVELCHVVSPFERLRGAGLGDVDTSTVSSGIAAGGAASG